VKPQVLAEQIVRVTTLKVPLQFHNIKRPGWSPATIDAGVIRNMIIHLPHEQLVAVSSRSPVIPGAYRGLQVMAPITTVYGVVNQDTVVDYNVMGVGKEHQLPEGMELTVDLLVTPWTAILTIKSNARLDIDVWLD
jgi:hypothetical protein